jgi:hypothetical protein
VKIIIVTVVSGMTECKYLLNEKHSFKLRWLGERIDGVENLELSMLNTRLPHFILQSSNGGVI